MSRLFFSCLFFLFIGNSLFAQNELNSYKYIIIQNQYDFQKTKDQYQINSLIKFLFKKEGFTALLTSENFPEDLAKNPCLGLKAIVKNNSGFLRTRLVINLLDCYNKVIFSTPEGISKIKEYKKAYHDATRKAFNAIKDFDYVYSDKKIVEPVVQTEALKTVTPVKEIVKNNSATFTIEGKYFFDMWGACEISKKGNNYTITGGDENFEFAKIFPTSKSTIYMLKKTGFKQTQLLELDKNGNLKLDTKNGINIYKRIH